MRSSMSWLRFIDRAEGRIVMDGPEVFGAALRERRHTSVPVPVPALPTGRTAAGDFTDPGGLMSAREVPSER